MQPIGADVLAHVHQLYGAQSRHIDEGRAAGWAATFTPNGEFRSPSYPEPAIGTTALVEFAERFAAADRDAGARTRHVITNLVAEPAGPGALTVHGYLQIVRTAAGESRLLRMTTFTDELVADGGTWRVRRREVRRDDAR
ncbi:MULTISPECIES: nuclear transport factor 2 family protein [unclassified Saccharopolyspora]|uniref:nuclear transport factor 2 family protein n=1 Tax=unclassified Saccharopolyspora TaxID=2646250 RepID=UPI001CD2687D|nr:MULTISPECIES: nuclear transport factor 2 family protein [unclassified Saccharopolyspora]MCA1188835.1 nuclear transport factor 2 family protein [Saccharopolyspora sp. 6T]MCA1281875.1 nuclear transport factor 2 family protein [Saccharopolyspora sp. 7B]